MSNLINRIRERCEIHVLALEKLSHSSLTEIDVKEKFHILKEHLRQFKELQPKAFDPNLNKRINSCSTVDANAIHINKISLDDETFVVGHFYLSEKGFYRVTALNSYPQITPDCYPPCVTPAFKQRMWEQHLKLLNESFRKEKQYREFAQNYLPPTITAVDEIDQLKQQYDKEVLEAHKMFLRTHHLSYAGTSKSKKPSRKTHCYNCKNPLDNAIDTECNACQWIVCSCGACGCVYSSKDSKSFNDSIF